MITFTEFFLFFGIVLAFLYGAYWRNEAKKSNHLFKLMLTNKQAREEIVKGFEEFERKHG